MADRTEAVAPPPSSRRHPRCWPALLALVVACTWLAGCAAPPGTTVPSGAPAAALVAPSSAAPSGPARATSPAVDPAPVAAAPSTSAAPSRPATAPVARVPTIAHPVAGSAGTVATVAAPRRPVARDVYQRGDFVTQFTDVACVGASVQMMLNMVHGRAVSSSSAAARAAGRPDRTPATQARLLALARTMSPAAVKRRTGGASAFGWAYALSVRGGGTYRVQTFPTLAAAVRAVATSIARTGRPAGLLVWQGVHAWVASGYRALGNPATDPRARVTGLIVSDPLWPRPIASHGRTIAPDTFLTTAALARHLVRFHRPWRSVSGLNGSFVVVLPMDVPPVGLARAV